MSNDKVRAYQSRRHRASAAAVLAVIFVAASCGNPNTSHAMVSVNPPDARDSQEAYVYAFPMVDNYETLYKQAVDTTSHDYRAPLNVLSNASTVATPEDKFVVTPNSDTPYSYLWMDLRAEPMVVTMPKIEKNRYYTGQLVDLYTFNFAYLGTRSYGNDGGKFVIAGPTERRYAGGNQGSSPRSNGVCLPADSHTTLQCWRHR